MAGLALCYNTQQKAAIKSIIDGFNTIITGPPGCGKSTVIKATSELADRTIIHLSYNRAIRAMTEKEQNEAKLIFENKEDNFCTIVDDIPPSAFKGPSGDLCKRFLDFPRRQLVFCTEAKLDSSLKATLSTPKTFFKWCTGEEFSVSWNVIELPALPCK